MKKGFTLVEVLISIFIFSIIMIITTSMFVYSLDLQHRALNLQQAEENASFILESMTKEIRVATIDPAVSHVDCATASPETTLSVTNEDIGTIRYYLSGTDLIREVDGASGPAMNSIAVQFTSLGFCVTGASTGDGLQPRITILATVKSARADPQAMMNIETSVSLRELTD